MYQYGGISSASAIYFINYDDDIYALPCYHLAIRLLRAIDYAVSIICATLHNTAQLHLSDTPPD